MTEQKQLLPYLNTETLKGHKGAVLVCRFNRNGQYCMTGGKDKTIRLWNPHKGTDIKIYDGAHGYEVLDIKVGLENRKFASVGGDKVALLWDVNGTILRRFRGHEQRINTCEFNKDCSVLVTGSYDNTIRCFDCRSRSSEAIQVLSDFKDSVSSVAITEAEIIAGSIDGKLRKYDVRMGKIVTDHISQSITSVALSYDENCILVSCLDDTIRLMDKDTGELLKEYTSHANSRYKVEGCLSNDDAYAISGSEDGQIFFWNLVDGFVQHKLQAHSRVVSCVSYHPTEVCLVSCSVDGNVKVWK